MAVPEKDNVSEIDLFSALGLGGGGAGASTSAGKDGFDDELSDLFGARKSRSSASKGDDELLDIFTTSGSPTRSSSSKGSARRGADAKVAQEREAQLKEKAIRSRQWKEELERKKREQLKAEEARRKESESEAAKEEPARPQKSEEPQASSVASKAASPAKEAKEIITVKANPVLLDDKPAPASRDAWDSREGVTYSGRYGRTSASTSTAAGTSSGVGPVPGGVSGGAQPVGAREARDIMDARQPRREPRIHDARATQPLPSQTEASASFSPQARKPHAAGMSQKPYGGASAMPQHPGASGPRVAHQQDPRAARPDQRPYQQPQRVAPSMQGMPQDPTRSRAAYQEPYPTSPSQELRQGAPLDPQPEEPPIPATHGKGRAKDDPLGIVLIVLAVLCVLVAASLLTGLWDISNL